MMKAIVVVMMLLVVLLTVRACGAPVVFEDRSGVVCGCLTDGDIPTLSQCDGIDRDSLHEVIVVSECE